MGVCPGCWYSKGCHKDACYRPCAKKAANMRGFWQNLWTNTGSYAKSTSRGTTVKESVTTAHEFTKMTSLSATIGSELGTPGGTAKISGSTTATQSFSETWRRQYSKDFTETKSQTLAWKSDGIPSNKLIWQWSIKTFNGCNEEIGRTNTWDFTYSDHIGAPPCCLPHSFKNGHGACCSKGMSMYPEGREPQHCACHSTSNKVTVSNSHYACNGIYNGVSSKRWERKYGSHTIMIWWAKPWWRCSIKGSGYLALWYNTKHDLPTYTTSNYCWKSRWDLCSRSSLKYA